MSERAGGLHRCVFGNMALRVCCYVKQRFSHSFIQSVNKCRYKRPQTPRTRGPPACPSAPRAPPGRCSPTRPVQYMDVCIDRYDFNERNGTHLMMDFGFLGVDSSACYTHIAGTFQILSLLTAATRRATSCSCFWSMPPPRWIGITLPACVDGVCLCVFVFMLCVDSVLGDEGIGHTTLSSL